jgi:hypothetical protein
MYVLMCNLAHRCVCAWVYIYMGWSCVFVCLCVCVCLFVWLCLVVWWCILCLYPPYRIWINRSKREKGQTDSKVNSTHWCDTFLCCDTKHVLLLCVANDPHRYTQIESKWRWIWLTVYTCKWFRIRTHTHQNFGSCEKCNYFSVNRNHDSSLVNQN